MKTFYVIPSLIFLFIGTMLMGQTSTSDIVITKADIEKVGASIPASAIGEPVGSVKLYTSRLVEATEATPA